MKILALEFSSQQRSVAVLDTDSADQVRLLQEVVESGPGATRGLALVDEVLHGANARREQIETVVIGLGPGSYTGVRAALALAQGWQLARPVNLIGISSARALAWQAHAERLRGRAHLVVDAQRGEFYLTLFDISDAGWTEVRPLRLATLSEIRELEQCGQLLAGPEVTRWFPSGRILFPRAAGVGAQAIRPNVAVAAEKMEPIYLRPTAFVKAPQPR
jgi:tRNA threonylcarbamoyladenosine biosynthesis protein TsaB